MKGPKRRATTVGPPEPPGSGVSESLNRAGCTPGRGSRGRPARSRGSGAFPGRFACDRYAAARRRTSFCCSSSRLCLRSSADCESVAPGRRPASTAARRSQFCRHVSEIPKSSATCLIVTSGARRWATATTSSRNSLGSGLGTMHILPRAPHGTTDQMSPIPAAVQAMPDLWSRGGRGHRAPPCMCQVLTHRQRWRGLDGLRTGASWRDP